MTTGGSEHSESGFLTGAYEGISRTFTDVEVITTSEVRVSLLRILESMKKEWERKE